MLLFDLIMPNRNGKEAYDEIRKVSPEVRILFMSGYTAEIIEAKDLDDGTEIILKPFSSTELANKVRMILDTYIGLDLCRKRQTQSSLQPECDEATP